MKSVLSFATVLMSLYATYSIGWAANDLFQGGQLEPWATAAMIVAGVLLIVGVLMTRATVPGGLPICAAALLALQALDVHNASHLDTPLALQFARGAFGLTALGLAALAGHEKKLEGRR